nr:probable polygalacturonase [Ipomoea trifida]
MPRFFRWILPCCAAVLLLVACLAVGEWETCSGIVLVTERSNRPDIDSGLRWSRRRPDVEYEGVYGSNLSNSKFDGLVGQD